MFGNFVFRQKSEKLVESWETSKICSQKVGGKEISFWPKLSLPFPILSFQYQIDLNWTHNPACSGRCAHTISASAGSPFTSVEGSDVSKQCKKFPCGVRSCFVMFSDVDPGWQEFFSDLPGGVDILIWCVLHHCATAFPWAPLLLRQHSPLCAGASRAAICVSLKNGMVPKLCAVAHLWGYPEASSSWLIRLRSH